MDEILEWVKAEEKLKACLDAYKSLVGKPNVNPWFVLGLLTGMQTRFESGTRSRELYDEIMEFEL